jgi:diadenosine tetraphosphate (Ap4A) HIT family hydrolase
MRVAVSECLVCREQSGDVVVPGGHLQADDLVVVFHSPIVPPAGDVYAGYLFVTPRRHTAGFAGLDDDESAAIGRALARWSRALEAAGVADRLRDCAR